MRALVPALAGAALLMHACAAPAIAPSRSQPAPTAAEPELQPVVVATQFVVGRQRMPIGVLRRNTPVNDAAVRVRVYRGSPSDPLSSDSDAPLRGEGLEGAGVYVAYVTFGAPGAWIAEILAQRGAGAPSVTRLPLNVTTGGRVSSVGQPAPRSRNATRKDLPDVSYIDSGNPPNDMHEVSIADAIAERRPTLAVFATPAFCTSRMCGPEVRVVQSLESAYGDRLTFIHVEIYQDFKPDPSKMRFTPTVLEWQLQSEPWVFLIDRNGVIRFAFEGPAAADELRAAVDELLRGS